MPQPSDVKQVADKDKKSDKPADEQDDELSSTDADSNPADRQQPRAGGNLVPPASNLMAAATK